MKGLKELKQTPITPSVKVKVGKADKDTTYYRAECYHAYTAEVVNNKENGEVLVIAFYNGSDNKSREHNAVLNIAERHFLTQNGEFASERYDSEHEAKPGDFVISTSDINNGLGVSDQVWGLIHGWSTQCKNLPMNNAEKVILGFAKRHKLLNTVYRESYPKKKLYDNGLSWFAAYQRKLKNDKKEAAKERLEMRTTNRMAQLSDGVPEDFRKWIEDEMLTEAAWFYTFEKRVAKGICGACGEITSIEGVKNKKKGTCPACGRPIKYISVKKMNKISISSFRAAFVEKVNDEEFVSRYFSVQKRYDSECTDSGYKARLDVRFAEVKREFWQVKSGGIKITGLYEAVYRYGSTPGVDEPSRWDRIPPRYGVREPGMIFTGNAIEVTKALAQQLNKPRFENIDIRPLFANNRDYTPVEIFCGVFRMPSIESMAKMGLLNLAYSLLNDREVIPINTGSPAKQLGVDRLVMQKFVEANITYSQWYYWNRWHLELNDWDGFISFIDKFHGLRTIDAAMTACRSIKLGTLTRYLEKQSLKYEKSDTLMCWSDYIQMAILSGLDLEHNRSLIYPQDVKIEHDRFSDMKDKIRNIQYENKLKERAKLLERLALEGEDFIIVPLKNVSDFINESNELKHCVKTYIRRCSSGETNIFGLRKKDEPEKPYFTVNISNHGNLIQNRGKYNCAPPKEVRDFVEKWLKRVRAKLKTMSLDPKITITQTTAENFRIGA
ncbi:MAG: PcfJ domain-containing protein [Oscillospiraceae bacterium]|nr:PcfJ domain-containing protein [Oscillospiraceae bacterium]